MIEFFRKTPFARILFPFICGIILAERIPEIPLKGLYAALFSAFLLLPAVLYKPGYYRDFAIGILLNVLFCLCGALFCLDQNRPVDFFHGDRYMATLLERPVKKINSYRTETILTHVVKGDSFLVVKEKFLIYFAESEKICGLGPGDRIVFERTPEVIVNKGNPFEFDYRKYVNRKAIYRQVYLGTDSWSNAGSDNRFRILVTAEKIRDYLLDIYVRNGLEGTEFEILSALTLGYRKSIDPEIKQVFAVTGATHILAVSGLHVGIVYLVFSMVFGFLKKGKNSRYLFLFLSVTCLWAFAFITGLSPSVQRAALMFSVVAAGENLHRPSNIYNTLLASAFILLSFNPNLLFDAGFQLSYAAVLGIVYFQPMLGALFHPPLRLIAYLWGLFTVSVAAQLTTFPLSASYFHQFPVYFWMSNLIVIPAAFMFIMLGILILVTSPFAAVSGFIAKIASFLVKGVYLSLQQIGELPGSLVSGFNFSSSSVVTSVFLLLFIILFIETRRKSYLFLAFATLPVFILTGAFQKFINNQRKEIIVYNSNHPLIHFIDGRTNFIMTSAEVLNAGLPTWEIKPVLVRYGLDPPEPVPFETDYLDPALLKAGMYLFFGGRMLVIDQGNITYSPDIKWDAVILPYKIAASHPLPPETTIVGCNPFPRGANASDKCFSVRERGAWQMKIAGFGIKK